MLSTAHAPYYRGITHVMHTHISVTTHLTAGVGKPSLLLRPASFSLTSLLYIETSSW